MITKHAFIGHPTRDLEKARQFYGELLGLKCSAVYGDYWSEFQTSDGATIALDTFSPKHAESPSVYMALETDDIAAEIARLKEQGVKVPMEVWENKDDKGEVVCKMAMILDPDGNGIMLHEIAPNRA